MFSREDAGRLRESLGPMDFQEPAPRSEVLQSYCDFYGLNFGSSQHPVSHCIGYLATGEFKVVCQHFRVPLVQQRGTAFVVHGYFDHVGVYSHVIEHCLRSGLSVVTFDLPGHGLSSGVEASIDSFRQYCAALFAVLESAQLQRVHSPWVIMGQSTGGAIVIDALLEAQLAERFDFAAYILLAPLLRPQSYYKSKLLFYATRWFLRSTRRKFAKNSHDPEFLNFLRHNDALQSQLLQRNWVLAMIDYQQRFRMGQQSSEVLHIIQGSGDGTVDWQYNLPQFLAKFPRSKTYMIADAGHHLVNEARPYRDRVFTCLDEIINKAVN